jgi:anti-sigma factor RsiW
MSLQLFSDGELDPGKRDDFLRHLGQCALCARENVNLTELRTRLRAERPYYVMPSRLEHELEATVARHARDHDTRDVSTGPPRDRRMRTKAIWLWSGTGALAGSALTIAGVFLVMTAHAWWSNRELVDEVANAHGRSSLTGHVVDIASSDHHTVKPWLSQRLDYSPPVVDLNEKGFPLLGGRLDRIEGMSVATLIYRSGQHRIDVFVRPIVASGKEFEPTLVRGYNVMEARGLGMEWIGVSDVNPSQLRRLVNLLAQPEPSPESVEPPSPP